MWRESAIYIETHSPSTCTTSIVQRSQLWFCISIDTCRVTPRRFTPNKPYHCVSRVLTYDIVDSFELWPVFFKCPRSTEYVDVHTQNSFYWPMISYEALCLCVHLRIHLREDACIVRIQMPVFINNSLLIFGWTSLIIEIKWLVESFSHFADISPLACFIAMLLYPVTHASVTVYPNSFLV